MIKKNQLLDGYCIKIDKRRIKIGEGITDKGIGQLSETAEPFRRIRFLAKGGRTQERDDSPSFNFQVNFW